MSPFLMNVTACVIVIIVNNSLQQYGGDMAIRGIWHYRRLLVLYVMIVLGLTMGMQPIVGYNFGAQKHDRVKATLRLTIIAGYVSPVPASLSANCSPMPYLPSLPVMKS